MEPGMSQPRVEEIMSFLNNVLEVSPAKATALILRDDYEEQIDVADPDEVVVHRDRALELLAWRGVQSAVHIFKRSGIFDYLSSARGEDLATLYCCERLSTRYREELDIDNDGELTIPVALPPDDDLTPLAGLVQLRNVSPTAGWITLWGEWTDLLGEPTDRIDWVNAVANAFSEGRRSELRERPVAALTELFDNVENIQSLQTVLADLIEKLISKIEGGAADQAYRSLQSILGRRLDGLCSEAQAALLASEQIRLSRDFADPSAAMMCFGRAVELQLRHQSVKRFEHYYNLRRGLYPKRENNLGGFLFNLSQLSESDRAIFAEKWCDPSRTSAVLSEFNQARNRATHGEPQAKQVVDSAIGDWLGATSKAVELWGVLTPG
jgi:hypothetical protein